MHVDAGVSETCLQMSGLEKLQLNFLGEATVQSEKIELQQNSRVIIACVHVCVHARVCVCVFVYLRWLV